MNRQQHHDEAAEGAKRAASLLQNALKTTEKEGATHADLATMEHLTELAKGLAAVAQVHATLATISDS